MVRLQISQLSQLGHGRFRAAVTIGDQPEMTVEVDDPGSPEIEKLLSWYYEKFPAFPHDSDAKRRRAETRLHEYGVQLFARIFGSEQVSRALEPCRSTGFDDCRLVISGEAEFHRLHWEAMRAPDNDEPLSVLMPVQRRIRDPKRTWAAHDARPSLNVLVVAARPYGADDLDYRSVTRVLLAESWNAEQPFQVDLARPGTWPALREHLRRARDRRAGYQAIHFDLHGVVGSPAALQERLGDRLRLPSGIDRAAEDAFLLFESNEPGVADAVPAGAVATLLAQHRIPMAVLNSCQSAKHPNDDSSLAERLAASGVRVVVGMAYSVTPAAVDRAMPAFYRAIAEGQSPVAAVKECRGELLADPVREVRPQTRISLQDWVVPIVYQQADDVDLHLRPMSLHEQAAHFAAQAEAGADPKEVIGRDFDVLWVERLLVSDKSHQILVYGAADVGKSFFTTRLLPWWWLRTGLVEKAAVVSFDEEALTVRDIVEKVAVEVLSELEYGRFQALGADARTGQLTQALRSRRCLLVLDSGHRGLPAREDLRRFLTMIRDGHSLVVITAREVDEQLAEGTFGANRYELHPYLGPARQPRQQVPPTPAVIDAIEPTPSPGRTKPVRTRPGGRRSLAVAGVVAAAALVVTLVARPWEPVQHDNGTAQLSTSAPAVSSEPPAGSDGNPTWVAGPAAEGIRIVSPGDRTTTKACVDVRGTAEGLAANETVAIAVRKRSAFDEEPFFFYLIADWTDPAAVRSWRVLVNLGTGNFQDYDIYALAADRQAVRDALARAEGNLTSDVLTTGLRRGAHVEVHQSGGC